MSNWPDSNSSDTENQCTSVHPEDPEIRCGRQDAHNGSHATAAGHWWKSQCTILFPGIPGIRCQFTEDHDSDHHNFDPQTGTLSWWRL